MGNRELGQIISLRLEVTFLKRMTLGNLLATGCSVA